MSYDYSKFTLSYRMKAWTFVNAKPMTTAQLARAMDISDYKGMQLMESLVRSGSVAVLPNGKYRTTDKLPRKKIAPPRPVNLEPKLKPNGTTRLRVPNSVWQWGAFV